MPSAELGIRAFALTRSFMLRFKKRHWRFLLRALPLLPGFRSKQWAQFRIVALRANKKSHPLGGSFLFGRGDRIRTCDPLLPKQMRYQTALLPELDEKLIAIGDHVLSAKKRQAWQAKSGRNH